MKVGSYDVIDRLGQGGMGIVLRARDPRGAEVAIKLLHSPDAGQASVRFAREERLLELLSADAGFVPLIDSGESAEGPWFAMPLLEGG
ncbi:MAG: serine/threonine protein kinase, partial [Planctomycetota bacterium]